MTSACCVLLILMMLAMAKSHDLTPGEGRLTDKSPTESSARQNNTECEPSQKFNKAYVKSMMAKAHECKTRVKYLEKNISEMNARLTSMQSQIEQINKKKEETDWTDTNCEIRLKMVQLNVSTVALETLKEQLDELKLSKQTAERHMKDKKQLVDAAERNFREQRTKMHLEHPLYMEALCNMTKERTIEDLNMMKSEDKYYYLALTRKSWYEADRFCRSHNLALVSIRDEAEMTRIVDYAQSVRAAMQRRNDHTFNDLWIGLSDSDLEGQYVWSSTGQNVTFSAWAEGEPSNSLNQEHCVELRLDVVGKNWNDKNCETSQRFMCEMRDLTCL